MFPCSHLSCRCRALLSAVARQESYLAKNLNQGAAGVYTAVMKQRAVAAIMTSYAWMGWEATPNMKHVPVSDARCQVRKNTMQNSAICHQAGNPSLEQTHLKQYRAQRSPLLCCDALAGEVPRPECAVVQGGKKAFAISRMQVAVQPGMRWSICAAHKPASQEFSMSHEVHVHVAQESPHCFTSHRQKGAPARHQAKTMLSVPAP